MSKERIRDFQKLTPTDKADLGIYIDAINKVFNEDDLENIAISGTYSSGKSSIVETYKKEYQEKRFLHISLAHFEATTNKRNDVEAEAEKTSEQFLRNGTSVNTEPNSGENQSYTSILEGKILNQLIHQIDPESIPQTIFKVKRRISKQRIAFDTVLVILSVLATLYTFLFEKWSEFIKHSYFYLLRPLLDISTLPIIRIIAAIFTSVCTGIFLYRFIYLQQTKSVVKRVSVKGTDIEILGDIVV